MNETKKPAIRFRGFSGEWKQSRVGELIEDYTEKTVVQNQYPVLTSSQQQGIVRQEEYFADRQVTTNDNVGYFVLPFGYFTYRSRSDTDVFVFNRNNLIDKGIISYYYPVFAPMSCDSNFLLRRLNYGIKKQLSMAAEGTGQKVLAHSKFKDMIVDVPDEEEQIKIGTVFEYIDNLIAQHHSKLEKLQSVKASMLEKMFPKDGADVPEVRCKGFTGAWKRCKMDAVLIDLQNNTLSRSELSEEKGIAKNIHYGDILVKFGEILNVGTTPLPQITNSSIITKYMKSFLQNGDVIVADTAEDETVGKCTEIAGINNEVIIAGLHTIPYRPLIHFASGYLGYYMNSSAYHNQLLPFMQGVKITSISKSSMKETSIAYPQSIDEQKQIGSCFQKIDNLISLQQQELEKLQSIKKALLEKMFV